jgi:hypothetical protein
LQLGVSKAMGKTLVIGEERARSEPPTSINAPAASHHSASLGVVHTPPPATSSKGVLDDGSP